MKEIPLSREEAVVHYLPFIKLLAHQIHRRLPPNIEFDDLVSAGYFGLIDALEKFDSDKKVTFRTYAEFRIRGAILDELRALDIVPRSIRDKSKKLDSAHAKLSQKLQRTPTDNEVAEYMGMSLEAYFTLLNELKYVSAVKLEDDLTNGRMVIASLVSKEPTPEDLFQGEENAKILNKLKAALPKKQRLVLHLYYEKDLNLKEIGVVMGVTESRISQLHTSAINSLRRRIKGKDLNGRELTGDA